VPIAIFRHALKVDSQKVDFRFTEFSEIRMHRVLGTSLPGSEHHPFGERAELGKLSSIRDFP
jgi:hypothetical protein